MVCYPCFRVILVLGGDPHTVDLELLIVILKGTPVSSLPLSSSDLD